LSTAFDPRIRRLLIKMIRMIRSWLILILYREAMKVPCPTHTQQWPIKTSEDLDLTDEKKKFLATALVLLAYIDFR